MAIEENKKLIAEIAALKEAPNFVPEEPEVEELRDEITALKQTLERQNLSSREEEEDEDPMLVPEVSEQKIQQPLSTSAKTMRSSTVQNVLNGLNAKIKALEDELFKLDGLYELVKEDVNKEEKKNDDYYTMIKQVEKQTKTKILDDYREVLPDVLKKAKDVALVDTPDTE